MGVKLTKLPSLLASELTARESLLWQLLRERDERISELENEIARLKGEKGKPKIKPSVSSQKARGWSPRKVRPFDRDCFGDHPLALVSCWDNEFDPGRNRVSGPNSMGIVTPLRKPSTGGESKERPADG